MTNQEKKEKKAFFDETIKKYEDVIKRTPWMYEITKEGKIAIREGIRLEYSKMKEMLDGACLRIKDEEAKPKPDQKAIEAAKKLRTAYDADLVKMEEQLKQVDQEIEACDRTSEDRVEACRAYVSLVKKCLKKIK